MPYKVIKEGGFYRIKTPRKTLKPHYKTRKTAERVKRYLYYIKER